MQRIGAAGARLPPMPPAESRAVLPAPLPSPPAAIRVAWIPPATTPRLLLQQQSAGGRGGDSAIIGADGSDAAPVDQRMVREEKEGGRERRRSVVVHRTAKPHRMLCGEREKQPPSYMDGYPSGSNARIIIRHAPTAPPSPPAVTRVAWIPPAATPRLLLQLQWPGARGGDCAIIGADGSGAAPGF